MAIGNHLEEKKCYKILDKVGLQTYDNAIKTCKQEDYTSNLVSIQTPQE